LQPNDTLTLSESDMHPRASAIVVGALLAYTHGANCGAQIAKQVDVSQEVADAAPKTSEPATTALTFVASTHAPIYNGARSPTDRSLFLIGLERRFVVREGRLGSVSTGLAVYPEVYSTRNRGSVLQVQPCDGPLLRACIPEEIPVNYPAFGFGVVPLSIRLESPPISRFRLAAHADGGGVWSTRRIPGTFGTHFNFLAQYGLDGRIRITTHTSIEPGYRHIHMSNAGTGEANPGLDISALVLGLSWS
jgi:hypothetical protein